MRLTLAFCPMGLSRWPVAAAQSAATAEAVAGPTYASTAAGLAATTSGEAFAFDNGAVPILPGAVEILGFSAGSYFTGKTASGTSVVYVTPGEGL